MQFDILSFIFFLIVTEFLINFFKLTQKTVIKLHENGLFFFSFTYLANNEKGG